MWRRVGFAATPDRHHQASVMSCAVIAALIDNALALGADRSDVFLTDAIVGQPQEKVMASNKITFIPEFMFTFITLNSQRPIHHAFHR